MKTQACKRINRSGRKMPELNLSRRLESQLGEVNPENVLRNTNPHGRMEPVERRFQNRLALLRR